MTTLTPTDRLGQGAGEIDAQAAARWSRRNRLIVGRTLVYAALIGWAFVSLFPIYWTVTTSMKVAVDVTQGHLVPWVDFHPDWKGWRSLGLSPDTIGSTSTVRDEFVARFLNSIVASVGGSSRFATTRTRPERSPCRPRW